MLFPGSDNGGTLGAVPLLLLCCCNCNWFCRSCVAAAGDTFDVVGIVGTAAVFTIGCSATGSAAHTVAAPAIGA